MCINVFSTFKLKLSKFDCPAYVDNILNSVLSFLATVLISLSFLTTFLITVTSIIEEKSSKTREYLKLIGVKPSVIWLGWIIRSLSIYSILSIIIFISSTYRIKTNLPFQYVGDKALFLHTEPVLILLICLIYSLQVASLALMIGQIFSKGKKSAVLFLFNFFRKLCILILTFLKHLLPKLYQYFYG